MASERLKYFIEAVWTGKGATAKAKRDISGVGKSAKATTGDTDGLTKSTGGMGKAFGALAAGGLIAAVGSQVLAFGKASINAASDAEESYGKFSVVFGEFADATERDLEAIADATGASKYELIDYASTIQDTFVPLGFAREKAAEMSTSITQLAIDLASFNNLNTADVVRDLQSALVGNTETLRKYGVVAQETQIKQEAITAGLWDGKGAIDAQAKAQAILNLTYAGTTDAQGDAVRTADSYANKQRALESATLDLKVTIGELLIPTMVSLTEKGVEAAGGLKAFFDVVGNGDEKIAAIVTKNIEAADSVEDYGEQLVKVQRELFSFSAYLTGSNDELKIQRERLMSLIAANATDFEDFVETLKEYGIEWGRGEVVQNIYNQARAIDDVGNAAALLTEQMDRVAAAQSRTNVVSLDYIVTTEEARDAAFALNDKILWQEGQLIQTSAAMEGATETTEGYKTTLQLVNEQIELLENRNKDFRVNIGVTGLDALRRAQRIFEWLQQTGGRDDRPDPYATGGDYTDPGDAYDPGLGGGDAAPLPPASGPGGPSGAYSVATNVTVNVSGDPSDILFGETIASTVVDALGRLT